jgi:DNA-directed RNA polymerase specialized sigma24 family protein
LLVGRIVMSRHHRNHDLERRLIRLAVMGGMTPEQIATATALRLDEVEAYIAELDRQAREEQGS